MVMRQRKDRVGNYQRNVDNMLSYWNWPLQRAMAPTCGDSNTCRKWLVLLWPLTCLGWPFIPCWFPQSLQGSLGAALWKTLLYSHPQPPFLFPFYFPLLDPILESSERNCLDRFWLCVGWEGLVLNVNWCRRAQLTLNYMIPWAYRFRTVWRSWLTIKWPAG